MDNESERRKFIAALPCVIPDQGTPHLRTEPILRPREPIRLPPDTYRREPHDNDDDLLDITPATIARARAKHLHLGLAQINRLAVGMAVAAEGIPEPPRHRLSRAAGRFIALCALVTIVPIGLLLLAIAVFRVLAIRL